jgi:thiosulfate/3-mercaptopyruvate sulfurtransferase
LGLYHDAGSVAQGGHIPGAKFAPIDAFLTPGRVKKFLNAATLRSAVHGLGADGPSILFCNTGHYSSGTWFVLHELAGNSDASMYDGSMSEWTRTGRATTSYVSQ